jgi:hypothetical protein
MKVLPIQVQEDSRTPHIFGQNRTSLRHIILKTTSIENIERILKAIREKKQITYKSKAINITVDFSTGTLKGHGMRYFRHSMKITSTLGYST